MKTQEQKTMNSGVAFYIEEGEQICYEEYVNGLRAKRSHIPTDSFLMFAVHLMEDQELLYYLLNNIDDYKEVFQKVFEWLFESGNYETLDQFMSFLDEKIDERDPTFTHNLYTRIVSNIKVQEHTPTELADQLQSLLSKVEKTNYAEAAAFNKMFSVILSKIHVNPRSSIPLIKQVVDKVMQSDTLRKENEHQVRILFDSILAKCDGGWIDEVIEKRRPSSAYNETPILPPGTIYYRETIGKKHVIVMEVPKMQRDVSLGGIHVGYVGHPKLIMIFTLNQQFKIVDMRVTAAPNVPIDFDTPLCRFPFHNVYDYSSTVCWPDQHMQIKSLSHLTTVVELFFKSPYSQDIKGTHSLEEFLNKDFDDKQLLPVRKTLKDFF